MSHLDKLARMIWPSDSDRRFVSQWCDRAQSVTVAAGQLITRQYHPTKELYFLLDGEVEHTIQLQGLDEPFQVGGISLRYFPLGWSGFSLPHRYATSARATTDCHLVQWSIDDLQTLLYSAPHEGRRFYAFLISSVLSLLADARAQLRQTPRVTGMLVEALAETGPPPQSNGQIGAVLAHSLFFEVFPPHHLERLAPLAQIRTYNQDEPLYQQGSPSQHLIMLLAGSVAARVTPATAAADVYLRSYTVPGQLVACPELSLSGRYEESATALTPTTVALIPVAALQQLADELPEFGLVLAQRLLWLVSARLRTLRIQLIAQRYDREQIAIQNLLAQVSPQLGIASQLYKLPHLLADRITHGEAFACIDAVRHHGSRLERTLAGVCVDILSEVWREYRFHKGLQQVYLTVTQAPLDAEPQQVRRLCSRSFQHACSATRYVIQGVDNLPDTPGHIFILNHLVSHPYHALPNGFEIALDTHFVSAMILDPKYGDGGVRVVRRGRGEEHGHHAYYDRLGHIYVHTAESDALATHQLSHDEFNQLAGDYLRRGINLIICPEGTSKWSHESPAPFRKGAFHLAAAIEPEPLIVPIAVANFDKRLKHNVYAAVVHEPFRISERCDPSDKADLTTFLQQFQATYRGYVEQAIALAQTVDGNPDTVPGGE